MDTLHGRILTDQDAILHAADAHAGAKRGVRKPICDVRLGEPTKKHDQLFGADRV